MPNGPPRILIVDDDVNITYAFKLGLERRGFLVDVFNDAAEVLGRTKPNSYQVAIFDFRMPKINGLELYRGFKKLNTETPVCFFTSLDKESFAIDSDIKESMIIKKPVSIVRLAEFLQEIIDSTG
jgi:DNA-binding response OmpR family regulator